MRGKEPSGEIAAEDPCDIDRWGGSGGEQCGGAAAPPGAAWRGTGSAGDIRGLSTAPHRAPPGRAVARSAGDERPERERERDAA